METSVQWFEDSGAQHTDAVLQAARARADALGLKQIVVASSTGRTALRAAEAFAGMDATVIGVTLSAACWEKYCPPDPALVRQAEAKGAKMLTATHTLMGNVGTAIREKFGGLPDADLIAYTLYLFSQGVKVAIEVVTMAADAGLLQMDQDVIGIAGTDEGADTALVVKPAYSTNLFDLKVREIIAMPR
jgi:hypothetical protein